MQQFSNKSQVIRDFFSFALHRIMIGPENSRSILSTNQNQTKTNRDLVARVFPRFKQFTSFRFVLF